MKRRAEESAEGQEEGVRRVRREDRGGGRGCHGGQRSGVATVGGRASGLARAPAASPLISTTTFFTSLRDTAQDVMMGKVLVSRLIDIASKKFVIPPSHSDWEGECELLVTVLYMALVSQELPWLLARDTLFEFEKRWLEEGTLSIGDWVSSLKEEWRCSAMSVMILLCANLSPEEWDITLLKEDLQTWDKVWLPSRSPPAWLMNATACFGDISAFTALLKESSLVLHNVKPNGDGKNSFVGSLVKYLNANKLYQGGNCEQCLDILNEIPSEHCGSDLQGWVSWLMGLCLAKLGSYHTSLVKLQEAVCKSASCIPAIFNISQIFHDTDKRRVEIETLLLIIERVVEYKNPGPMNLQSAILSVHHTPIKDLPQRALCLVALRCLEQKMYTEAAKHFTLLINQLEGLNEPVMECRTLLRYKDQVPRLPETRAIMVAVALAQLHCKDSEKAIRTLESQAEGAEVVGSLSLYEASDEGKMMCVIVAARCLIMADAFSKLGSTTAALSECSRLEQGTVWVSGINRSGWDQIMLKAKVLLYKMLSTLHASRQDHQSQQHYRRRSAQCQASLRSNEDPAWSNHLSLSHKILVDIFSDYVNGKLRSDWL